MGVKGKRKAVVNVNEQEEKTVDSSQLEPPVKKIKVTSADKFIQELRGPNSSQAVKQWLFLISNEREQAQMKRSQQGEEQSNDKNDDENGEDENGEDENGEDENGEDENGEDENGEDESGEHENQEDEQHEIDYTLTKNQKVQDMQNALYRARGTVNPENTVAERTEEGKGAEHIDAFINAGGSLSDIIFTLPSPDNLATHLHYVKQVFRTLFKVLVRISTHHKEKIPGVVDVCQQFLTMYADCINHMLKNRTASAANLRLLTAMAALDSKVAKDILYKISLDAEMVDSFTSLTAPVSVRVTYINFLIGLLIDADSSLIMAVTLKPWLLTSIMDGLQYDPFNVVVLLILTIKKMIVENMAVPKTTKLRIFNPDVIISLLHLYKWKGTGNRPQTKSLKAWAVRKANKPKLMKEIDSFEAEHVASAVHQLLLVLLTSYRQGIIFKDAHQSDRHNSLVSKVLTRVGHPWENPKVADLISKILAACPELLRSTLLSMEHFIQPRSSTKWFNCVKFFKQVLDDQRTQEVLRSQLPMPMPELKKLAMDFCMPMPIVRALSKNKDSLCNEDITVAKCTLDLFVHMLRKVQRFVGVVKQWASEKVLVYAQSTYFLSHVKQDLAQRVLSLDDILKVWQLWSGKHLGPASDPPVETEEPKAILFLLIELLELYAELCPSALQPFLSGQSSLKSCITDVVLNGPPSEDIAVLRNRFFQLLLNINDTNFNAGNIESRDSVTIVFNDLISSNPTVRSMALSVLQNLLQQAGSLEGSSQEAVLWLSTFQETFTEKRDFSAEMVTILVESMIRACTSCRKYLDIIAQAEEEAAETSDIVSFSSSLADGTTWEELFEELCENQEIQLPSYYLIRTAKLTPWLPAFLEVLKEKKLKRHARQAVEEFCSKLMVRLLYRSPYSGAFLHLTLSTYSEIVPCKLSDYLRSWLPGGDPRPIDSVILGEDSLEEKLGHLLFFSSQDNLLQDEMRKLVLKFGLLVTDKDVEEKLLKGKRLQIASQVVQLVHFICFHLTQLAQLKKLTKDCVHICQEILVCISEMVLNFDKSAKKAERIFCECFKVVLSHPLLFQQFNPLVKHNTEASKLLTGFMFAIAKTLSTYQGLETDIAPYKEKLLANLKLAITKKKNTKENVASMVQSFHLKFEEISNLLVLITDLPSVTVQSNGNPKLSQWFYLAAYLFDCASNQRNQSICDAKNSMVLPSSVLYKVSMWILDLLKEENLDPSPLIEGFRLYIVSCPQQTVHVSDSLFSCLLSTNQCNPSISKLAVWLASSKSTKEVSQVLKLALEDKKHLDQRISVILPVIRVAIDGNRKALKKILLLKVYEHIKPSIEESMVSLANHPEWLSENADVVVLLMKRFMQPGDREKLCKALEKKAPALTQEKLYYLHMVVEVLVKNPPQLLLILLAWLGVGLKKYENSTTKASLVVPLCQALVKFLKEESHEDFSTVRDSKVWQETLRLAVKLGLSPGKKEEDNRSNTIKQEDKSESSDTDVAPLLLQALAIVFEKMYSVKEPDHEHLFMVHSMIIQHSRFINVMMSTTPSKFELIQLLYVLVKRCPKLMESSHAPVLLSAYNASLSKSDRALLKILMFYEQSGVDFSHYRPYFWGGQGADFYSIWSHSKSTKSLEQQPKSEQVLGLLNIDMVQTTIAKFPIDATLKVEDTGIKHGSDHVYDPSFCLPLFIYLLSPESTIVAHMFVRSGALAISLASLSSLDEAVRSAAYTVLSRFVLQIQMARGRNKELLLQFMTALQNGMSVFDNQNHRLPNIVSVFLAKTSLEISNPFSELNQSLINFTIAKSAMDLETVPEFLTLLHSNFVEHVAHRRWILRVLQAGLRTQVDIALALKVVVFKLLLTFYTSCLADLECKVNILYCIRSAVGIQYGACCLVKDYSLSPWLHQTIISMDKEDLKLVQAMVKLLSALWSSLSLPTDSETAMPHVPNAASKVCHLLLALHPKLSGATGVNALCEYVTVLDDVVAHLSSEETAIFSKDHLLSIIEFCPNKREFFELLDLGCDFVDCKASTERPDTNLEEKLRVDLRRLVLWWVRQRGVVEKGTISKDASL